MTQIDYLLEWKRLLEAITAAKDDPEARDLAEHDLAMFLRLNAQGRLAEWFDRVSSGSPSTQAETNTKKS